MHLATTTPHNRLPACWLAYLLAGCRSPRLTSCPQTPAAVQTATDKLGESRAALERKAALYDRLARGEVDDEGEPSFCCRGCSTRVGIVQYTAARD
jgi:hypothetical protein